MTEELKSGLKWQEVIDSLSNSEVLEVKFTQRRIKKKKRREEELYGDTLFIKRKDADNKTVYRKNIKEDKENFLKRNVNDNIIDYLNANLFS